MATRRGYADTGATGGDPWQEAPTAAAGDDPRAFVFEGDKYTVTLDDDGAPFGVTYFGGARPTTLAVQRLRKICKAEFVAAATEAASRAIHAVKSNRLQRKAKTNGKPGMAWRVVG